MLKYHLWLIFFFSFVFGIAGFFIGFIATYLRKYIFSPKIVNFLLKLRRWVFNENDVASKGMISKCCSARVNFIPSQDFLFDSTEIDGSTSYYVCAKCGNPCDWEWKDKSNV